MGKFAKLLSKDKERKVMDLQTATRLMQLRKDQGLSQEQLADKLNVSRQAVSKWERAEASPDTDNLIALAKLYGVSLDELLQMDALQEERKQQMQILPANDDIIDEDEQDSDTPTGSTARILYALVPIVCTIIFLIMGIAKGIWHPTWLVFLAIPVGETLISAIERKRFCDFAYPILCVIVFLLLGFKQGLWSIGWVVFLTIPIYYTIFGAIDSKKHKKDNTDKEQR